MSKKIQFICRKLAQVKIHDNICYQKYFIAVNEGLIEALLYSFRTTIFREQDLDIGFNKAKQKKSKTNRSIYHKIRQIELHEKENNTWKKRTQAYVSMISLTCVISLLYQHIKLIEHFMDVISRRAIAFV